jgi:hypothetical protein
MKMTDRETTRPMTDDGVTLGELHGSITNVRVISQSDISNCPYHITLAEHYRQDGSCRCDDPKHTEMADGWRAVCEACADGEHDSCEEPFDTRMEWDTGVDHVTRCCCHPFSED